MIGVDVNTGTYLAGLEHLKQSVEDILTTPKGTRVMRRDYGCAIWELLDMPMSRQNFGALYAAVAEAIDKWEPRLSLERVEVESVSSEGKLTLAIEGRVVDVDLSYITPTSGALVRLSGIAL